MAVFDVTFPVVVRVTPEIDPPFDSDYVECIAVDSVMEAVERMKSADPNYGVRVVSVDGTAVGDEAVAGPATAVDNGGA